MSAITSNTATSKADSPPREQAIRDHAGMPDEPVMRLTVEQYHRMIDADILESGDPVELLDGFLVTKMTIKPPHATAVRLVRRALEQLLGDAHLVDGRQATTTQTSEPEPDVFVARGGIRDYAERHPGPADLLLVVEVAEASLRRDRTLKQRVYAAASIPVYWIVNLIDRQVEVYRNPSPSTGGAGRSEYLQRETFAENEEVPVVINGTEVGRFAVASLLSGIKA